MNIPPPPPGISTVEWILLVAIGTIGLGVAGLLSWVIKGLGPKILLAFEKRNDALVGAAAKTADAVAQIPLAIKSFETALTATEGKLGDRISITESKLVDRISEVGEKIIGRLDDRRLEELAAAMRARDTANTDKGA